MAITEGLVLMPAPFADGLDLWSSEDGTTGSATYDGAANAAFVPADQDFAGCLELQKTEATQKLRYMGETPILPGCYLRITARVKAISGNLPSVRIGAWAGDGSDNHVTGLIETGPSVALSAYGEVVEVSAIVGSGNRGGVDMVWGSMPDYGHFGLDLTGATGGILRIDDIVIEDITEAFLRDMMDVVDVRDYGAVGDGVTDDRDAINAADQAAAGRTVLIPEGTFFIGSNLTIHSKVRFEGTVSMTDATKFLLIRDFDLPTYIDAFGDEVLAFRKAFQALLNYTDHDALDMGGRRIELYGPIDMQEAVNDVDTFEIRRVIRNGQFYVFDDPAWTPDTATSSASYNPANPYELTNVANVASVPAGALVEGAGVGREVYVKEVNVSAQTVTLSQPLYAPSPSQSYSFTRFKYVLDFSGFTKMRKMTLSDIEFQMNGKCSGLMLPLSGDNFQVKDCVFLKPKQRGITSTGRGCQDLHIDRCMFFSAEDDIAATARTSVGFNVNANDTKIRDSRFQRLGLTGILHGSGHLIVGNHWFQGDGVPDGPRVPGLVFTYEPCVSVITGNYIDNCYIEWTNEHDQYPDHGSEYTFGGLTITGNIFMAIDAASHFSWIVVKPYGAGHYISGLHVNENTFYSAASTLDRVEAVDDSIAPLDNWSMRNITFERNTFHGIAQRTINPVTLEFAQNSDAATWTLDVSGYLPFSGNARTVSAIVAEGQIQNGSGGAVTGMPYAKVNQGASYDLVQVVWPEACHGTVHVTARMDRPT